VLAEVGDWTRRRFDTAQGRVFLYGHSIGGMLSLLMANADPSGYSGVSMTGSGAVYHERALQGVKARLADPATGTHSMSPEAARRAVFMGPPWSYDMEVTKLDPDRDVPSLVADLRDAVAWADRLKSEAGQARVPVQFVVPEYDGLWRADAIQGVREWFSGVPFADVYVQRHAGHCVELHHLWRSHVMKVVAFAEECRAQQQKAAAAAAPKQ
jgi:pimeloyl-ACP methyl ester carboxylesterase